MEEEHGGDGDSASAAEIDETSGMSSASSDIMEQTTTYIAGWEGGQTVYKNSAGEDCYMVLSDGAGGYAIVGLDTRYYGSYFQNLGYNIGQGSLIPVDVVIAKKTEAIKEFYDGVEARISAAGIELTQYQMAAVTSRAFNCGVDGAFTFGDEELTSAYKKYWKQNRDDKYNKSTTADFSHKFYTNSMSKPVTSGGQYMAGLENRRKSEFTLFQCGYNTLEGKYFNYSASSNSGTGGSAIASSGDGYDQVYKSSTGRTYKDYEQWKGRYSGISFFDGTIADSGCSITSVATILTGYGKNVTPGDLAGYTYMITAFKDYGLNCSSGFEGIDKKKLTSGKPALVNISGTLVTEKRF